MSAQEPRRSTKVTPRRNLPISDAVEPGVQYDSDEVPVLIRLPDWSEVPPPGQPTAPGARTYRFDDGEQNPSKNRSRRKDKKQSLSLPSVQLPAHNKLLIGGVLAGVVVVALLFFFNGQGSEPTSDGMAWPQGETDSSLIVEEPSISIPDQQAAQSYQGFAYEASSPNAGDFAADNRGSVERPTPSGSVVADQHRAGPEFGGTWGQQQTPLNQTAPSRIRHEPAQSWPEEVAGPSIAPSGQPDPGPRPFQYPSTQDDPSQGYRSGMYGHEHGYRTVRRDRASAESNPQDGVLNRTIETPPPTSLR
jgi:hypothetical protein